MKSSDYHCVKYYNVSGIKQVIINGITGNNIVSYAFSDKKNISEASVADIIIKKEIIHGVRFISEVIDIPENVNTLYLTLDKSDNENHILNHYPLNVYSIEKQMDNSIVPIPHGAIFNDFIIYYNSNGVGYRLLENKGNFKVALYDISQYKEIRICGYAHGGVIGYAFTTVPLLDTTIITGMVTSSSHGIVFFDETIEVPETAKFIYVTQNYNMNFPLTVCKSYNTQANEHLNQIQIYERSYFDYTDYLLCPIYGQSLAVGGDAKPITKYGNLRHREYMHCNENFICSFDTHETSKYGLMESFIDSYASIRCKSTNQLYSQIISFVQGQGSLSIKDFVKGSSNYNSLINKIKTAYDWAHVLGKTLSVPAFCWI